MTGSVGFWRKAGWRRPDLGLAALLWTASIPLAAAPAVTLSVPAGTLDQALLALARATGAEIISTEPGLRAVRTGPVSGPLSVRAALDRLLAGTGYRAVRSGGGYRVVFAPRRPEARPRPAPPPTPPPPAEEVVVTASKQRVTLLRYPGTLSRIAGTPTLPSGQVAAPSDLGRTLPVLQSTQLGPGRNKVFVRGIADSSFNGTTLSTVSVYLDDVQLSTSGPDPGLRLYDLKSVEVMEGPQGTLYGAGSIGGVVRLSSNPPDLAQPSGLIDGGASLTRSGGPGADLAATVNLPIVDGRLAVRGVGYGVVEGGYIDDPDRRASNTNRTTTAGLRLTAALAPGDGWRVEAGGALQVIRARDGQYARAGDGPLARRTALAQPFTGDFRLGRAVVEKGWDSGLRFVSATGVAAYDTAEVFDATVAGGPAAATSRTDTQKLLVSHEMRLSRSAGAGSWLLGVTLISDQSVLLRSAGALDREVDVTGVRNLTRAASLFGEATATAFRDLAITMGARFTVARVDSEPSQVRRAEPYVRGQTTRRIDPTVAVNYRVVPGLAVFARHQTGFRTGGLAVARGIGRVANFDPDSMNVNEVGLRRLRPSATGLELSVSLSRAHWTNIQADLLSRRGQPYTANIGDATIGGVEATLDWRPTPGLSLIGSALYTQNRVYGPLAEQSLQDNRRLPETPALGGYAEAGYAWRGRRFAPSLAATLTYVGPSVLGTGDLFDTRQGGYVVASAAAGLKLGRNALSLRVDNLTDSRADRFAFGNPMGLPARDQRTPLQPRTVRLGFTAVW